ncbi:MAG: 23S rRNA (pseudouridine(1915)-N(3))-methyltransferase RlmH [Gemmatimonadota bacterium]|jgi:23S rRNA (pseudouridine1915-N3)-methyltransferase|nr:23S rRNA (pseudouridine(1915)-N(3))-methyltransferase RlmH [Gemmatimonadota bacterium]MDQ8146452.1 23S rRNA (pseudouridine(1915)-N(3))-methyltransferase RlmH [Gemmatimonadota bacterium]MDQ8148379.1 23S rRNA (pseudouridine(1915)-N(3))-methyltransferase RlmH [Gemmatimonadota bacterium]MDQ8156185.1 23S rRNA (pseudouridine(1915)-N(3))-methyltransferase RlmH [Gemmatimonadota bacterium]MDQ8176170.1 23S rRNA (pseudouridine(1915)-N(3))-methyltransferase RlmH [Gemmatimonadota bacterium]
MRVAVRAVGRPKAEGIAVAIAEYERRAARYWPLEVVEVREAGTRGGDADGMRRLEGERLLDGIGGGVVVACDPNGESVDSTRFAAWLHTERERARDVTFVIGGAHGLDGAVLDRATRRLSLAPWTLPHELARLVLAEQLYRAGTIVRGEPYHK